MYKLETPYSILCAICTAKNVQDAATAFVPSTEKYRHMATTIIANATKKIETQSQVANQM